MAHVEVLDETERFPRVERLEAVLAAYLDAEGWRERELTVVLVDDEAMAERNERDRGVTGPTDVLSYPTFEPDGKWFPGVAHLGDVFISLDTARRQALEHGHDLETEVLVLAGHAITHLVGFDHVDEAAWRPFLEAQAKMVALAGEADGA